MTLGYVPTCSYLVCHGSKPIRLACLIHAASIHPELGSNSKLRQVWSVFLLKEKQLLTCEHIHFRTVLLLCVLQCSIQRIRQKRMYDPTLGVASFVLLMRTVVFLHRHKWRCLKQHVHLNWFLGEPTESYVIDKIQLPRSKCVKCGTYPILQSTQKCTHYSPW